MQQTVAPSPALIFDTFQGHQRTAALRAGIDLELFTAIAEGADTTAAIASRCRASERGVRVLCDFLTILGFLTKTGDRYALTPDSAVFLNKRSPAYMGGIAEFIASPDFIARFSDLTGIVRRGAPEETAMVPDNPIWVVFARAMAPMMAMPAQLLAELLAVQHASPLRVLDVAAGHGLFGLAIAQVNPKAEITALDWKPVLEVAVENATKAGVAARFHTLAGDALAMDLGGPYDLILVPNFIHHFDVATCTAFFRKVRTALAKGGRVAILDFVPDDNRVTPPAAAAFAMTMLGVTASGDAYTFGEYQRMLGDAGFKSIELHPLPPTMEQVVTGVNA
jgi:2-polyprenyl-3-methyl-5-hydroxy-6-metoxy-1,4-benzoquinol methylase